MHVRDLKSPPVVGEVYLVDCVILKSGQEGEKSHFPILGPAHADQDYGVVSRHFHYDQRFMTDNDIMNFGVIYYLDDHELPEVIEWPFQCVRKNFPISVFLDGLVEKYQKAIWDEEKQSWRCPHKGMYLGNLTMEKGGCLTCPMHSLKIKCWNGVVSGIYPSL